MRVLEDAESGRLFVMDIVSEARMDRTVVEVRPLEEQGNDSQGQRMAEALEAIAAARSLEGVDAAAWEREERAERPLPGRSG